MPPKKTLFQQHSIEDCAQNPTIEKIERTLDRLDSHSERTALALEQIAAQSVMVQAHEKRLDKHDKDLGELFNRVRVVEDHNAKEDGAKEVIEKQEKFWTDVKLKVLPYFLAGGILAAYAFDKLNIGQSLLTLWKELKG